MKNRLLDTAGVRRPGVRSPRCGAGLARFLALSLACVPSLPAADVLISINTSHTGAFPRGFSGLNAPQLRNVVEYQDTNFLAAVTALKPGWVRFPAGAAADAYDWNTGNLNTTWVDMFAAIPNQYALLSTAQKLTQAKGGVRLSDFSTFASTLGVGGIVCFNTFTDANPSSANRMVLAAQGYNLNVALWELSNEPFFFAPSFFYAGASDFAAKMLPYYNDIVSADPGAVVSLPFAGQYTGLGGDFTAWDQELAAYSPRFWNAVATHIYPLTQFDLPVADAQAFLNGILAHGSKEYVDSHFLPLIGGGTPIFITEFNCTAKEDLTFQTYLYNGVFLVEYIIRMSSHPSVKGIGVHAMYMGNYYKSGMIKAGRDFEGLLMNFVYPGSVNTSGWPFNFFTTAPGLALAVANEAVNNSTLYYRTIVRGGATVPITGFDGQPIPAVYAQAYKGDNGKNYLVITNKAPISQTAVIRVNGVALAGPLNVFYVANNDPTAANTASNPGNVRIVTGTAAGTITIPAHCVMRLEW